MLTVVTNTTIDLIQALDRYAASVPAKVIDSAIQIIKEAPRQVQEDVFRFVTDVRMEDAWLELARLANRQEASGDALYRYIETATVVAPAVWSLAQQQQESRAGDRMEDIEKHAKALRHLLSAAHGNPALDIYWLICAASTDAEQSDGLGAARQKIGVKGIHSGRRLSALRYRSEVARFGKGYYSLPTLLGALGKEAGRLAKKKTGITISDLKRLRPDQITPMKLIPRPATRPTAKRTFFSRMLAWTMYRAFGRHYRSPVKSTVSVLLNDDCITGEDIKNDASPIGYIFNRNS